MARRPPGPGHEQLLSGAPRRGHLWAFQGMLSFHASLSCVALPSLSLTCLSPDHKEVKWPNFLVHAKLRLSDNYTDTRKKQKQKQSNCEKLVSAWPTTLLCVRDWQQTSDTKMKAAHRGGGSLNHQPEGSEGTTGLSVLTANEPGLPGLHLSMAGGVPGTRCSRAFLGTAWGSSFSWSHWQIRNLKAMYPGDLLCDVENQTNVG